jgi:hypothetical protein
MDLGEPHYCVSMALVLKYTCTFCYLLLPDSCLFSNHIFSCFYFLKHCRVLYKKEQCTVNAYLYFYSSYYSFQVQEGTFWLVYSEYVISLTPLR